MVWLPVFGTFNVGTDVNACDCTWELCGHCKSLHWKSTPGERSLAAPGTHTCISIAPAFSWDAQPAELFPPHFRKWSWKRRGLSSGWSFIRGCDVHLYKSSLLSLFSFLDLHETASSEVTPIFLRIWQMRRYVACQFFFSWRFIHVVFVQVKRGLVFPTLCKVKMAFNGKCGE